MSSNLFTQQEVDLSTITNDLNLGTTSSAPSISLETPGVKSGGVFDWIEDNFIKLVIIILILAFLGFNLFTFMGETTNLFLDVVKPVAELLGFTVGETMKKTVDTSAKGTKLGIDVASGAIDDAINLTEEVMGVNPLKDQVNKQKPDFKPKQQPEADDATSRTQASKSNNKSGFCFIGEDRGFRSCISVKDSSKCMSGKVFASQELCENPNLRE